MPGNSSSDPPRAPGGAMSAAASTRVINAEVLTEGQRRAVNRYLELSRSSGVLVGAHAGGTPWDIRPLVLEGGVLHMLRFSDPALALERNKYNWLKSFFERRAGIVTGEVAGQLWVKRRYYPSILADDSWRQSASVAERFSCIASVVHQLKILHGQGLIHGHLCCGNIVRDAQGITLLDAGFLLCGSSTPEESTCAPELRASFPPASAVDVFGLGVLIRDLLQDQIGTDVAQIMRRALAKDPKKRPTIDEIAKLFAEHIGPSTTGAAQAATTSKTAGASLRSGKVIAATMTAPPTPPPPKEPPPQPSAPEPPPPASSSPPLQPSPEIKQTLLIPRSVIEEAKRWNSENAPPAGTTSVVSAAPQGASASPPSSAAIDRAEASLERRILTAPSVPSRTKAMLLGLGVLVAAVLLVRQLRIPDLITAKRYDIPTLEYWKSGQKQLMSQVAEAAIIGRDRDARSAIIEGARANEGSPLVHAGMLRFALDSRWGGDLSEADQDIVFRLALSPLYPEGLKDLPPLDTLNPIVLIALLGNVPTDKSTSMFSNVPSKMLTNLPEPLKGIFAPVVSSSSSMADRSVRTLAQLALGESSEPVLRAYFAAADPKQQLRSALPLLVSNPGLAPGMFEFLQHGQTVLADFVSWFGSEELAQWEPLPPRIKLFILAGEVPPSGLSLEQYADLLQFPEMTIRAAAAASLMKNFLGPEHEATIAFLGGDSNQLGRFQTIALVASLKLDPDSFYSFLGRWFEANPDPGSIIRLLLARAQIAGVDTLNFQAASYLKRAKWEASLKDLTALSQHPEGLARALAYSRLDPAIPNERAVLQEALKREPNPNFRDEVARRLRQNAG
ncbi:MAG: protein kinase family protein [Proteobacteria bacterium]|nr:protein kinase family protein [Pseudomonadota bacterium]